MTKHLPTIGIEIELPWKTMLRRVDEEAAIILEESKSFYNLVQPQKQKLQNAFDTLDERYKDLVGSMFGEKICERHDGYREFALTPEAHYQQLVQTTEQLYESGVLVERESYPLHVTLADISFREGGWPILMAAEICDGASPERVVQTNSWSRKGEAGIKERGPAALQLGATVGIEMRSLEVTGLDNLDQVLRIIQTAGGVLLARFNGVDSADVRWKKLKEVLRMSAEEKEVDVSTRWRNPQDDIKPWQAFSEALIDVSWRGALTEEILDVV